ncbi:MAG: hypothetical protein HQL55_16975 [Magnetococcales bacterium]|nr:hypothetical protein [Magnetococcales bacterium]
MLYITEKAARMVGLSAQSAGCEGMDLRLSYHADQVGAARFRMGFDEAKPEDVVWECQGITVRLAPQFQADFEHLVLDFQDIPAGGAQFVFLNLR